ncbi:MAG: hypothetical protein QM820_05650 [Minicystis sp.]
MALFLHICRQPRVAVARLAPMMGGVDVAPPSGSWAVIFPEKES